jgi:hypothetical protein
MKVKFLKNAPSGFDGYGRIEELSEKQYENFSKAGIYEIEVVKETPKAKPKPAPKKKSSKKKK